MDMYDYNCLIKTDTTVINFFFLYCYTTTVFWIDQILSWKCLFFLETLCVIRSENDNEEKEVK